VGLGQAVLGGVLGMTGGVEVMRTPVYATVMRVAQVAGWLLTVAYFAVAEGWWGRGLGKYLLGLRVIGPDGERPGLGRALVRALFVPGALGTSLAVSLQVPLVAEGGPGPMVPQQVLGMVGSLILGYVPLLLCLTTMRARNGYRGIHELASG